MPTTTVQTATVLKQGQGIIRAVNVCVAGSSDGMVCDAASVGVAAAANAVLGTSSTQARAEPIFLPINCQTGIVVVPGRGQTIWINWE